MFLRLCGLLCPSTFILYCWCFFTYKIHIRCNCYLGDHLYFYPVIWKILGFFSSPSSRKMDHPLAPNRSPNSTPYVSSQDLRLENGLLLGLCGESSASLEDPSPEGPQGWPPKSWKIGIWIKFEDLNIFIDQNYIYILHSSIFIYSIHIYPNVSPCKDCDKRIRFAI